jgi:hypothetical protein
MNNIMNKQQKLKQASVIALAIFAVVTISALAIITAFDDASALVVRHGSFHGKHHSGHATCVRFHGHIRCHAHGH